LDHAYQSKLQQDTNNIHLKESCIKIIKKFSVVTQFSNIIKQDLHALFKNSKNVALLLQGNQIADFISQIFKRFFYINFLKQMNEQNIQIQVTNN
jgi:hypothetical protein